MIAIANATTTDEGNGLPTRFIALMVILDFCQEARPASLPFPT
jgi:hypothetical protein